MTFYLQPADANGNVCPTVLKTLVDHLPGRVDSQSQADCVLVVASWLPGYVFNPNLLTITKPVILLDYLEFGWDAGEKENRVGTGAIQNFTNFASDEWKKLDDWVMANPPALTFKRELFQRDRTDAMLPAEYLCSLPVPEIETKSAFDSRQFPVFNCWGYSHPSRPRLHGRIFQGMSNDGIDVVSDWSQFPKLPPSSSPWVSIYSPYWVRQPIERVMEIQGKAKISVSLPGSGRKSFRDAESPVNAIMARVADNLEWSYRWDESNSIQLPYGNEFSALMEATRRKDLWDVYRAGVDNLQKYRSENYCRDYVLPAIERML